MRQFKQRHLVSFDFGKQILASGLDLNMLFNHLNNNKYISFNKEQNWVFLFHKIVLIYKLIVMNIIQLN